MALRFADKVKVRSFSTGSGTIVLETAFPGFQSFAAIGTGNECYYGIEDAAGNWEVGQGTYDTDSTVELLSRDIIISSSNSNNAVNFPPGAKSVFVTIPSSVAANIISSTTFAFRDIEVAGQSTVSAESTTDTLTLVAGTGIAITTNAITDTITITGSAADRLVNGANEVVLGADGTLTFPSNTLKTVNGTDAVAPSTNSTAGASLTITAGTGGSAATSQNAGNGGDLTITAGNAGSDIGNPSWGAIGGDLVVRAGNSTQPYAGGNVEIRSGTSASIPGTISLHTGTNQLTFDATGRLVKLEGITLTAGGQFNICTIQNAGSGYNTGSALKATTGGSGTGMTVGIGYGLSNQLASVDVVDPGTGYVDGDVITVSEGTGGTFVLTRYNVQANQGNGNFVESNWVFDNNGDLLLPGTLVYPTSALQRDTGTVECPGNASTVVYTASSDIQYTIKLLIQVEGFEGAAAATDSQACEMIVTKSFRADDIASSVYGVVHTSVVPLATFTAEWNALTSRIEILCTTPSANAVYVRTFATEIQQAP